MQPTSSQHPGRLRLVRPSGPATPARRAVPRPRRARLAHRHVLLIGPDDARERPAVATHTAGLAEHLTRTVASVCVLPAPSGPGGLRVRWAAAALPHSPDVVVAVLPGLTGAVAAARLAARHHAPLVLVAHDLLAARTGGPGGRGLTVAAAAERRLLRAASRVGVVVPELTGPLYDLGVPTERVHLLPHWAPPEHPVTDRLADPRARAAARRTLGWPVRPFTVVTAGGRGTHADMPTVRAAAGMLRDEAAFVVLDDAVGPLAADAADVLLLTERPDSGGVALPGTLARYLATGRPVLASVREDGPVAAELGRAAGAGLVVPPGRPELLAAAVRSLRADEGLRLAMGRAAARHAAERLDHRTVVLQFEEMLAEALGEVVVDLTTA